MTCQSVQARILALPDPRRLPDAFRAHVAACPDCAAYWKQAARLETLVAALPVPPAPAGKKTAFLDDLAAEALVFPKVTAPPPRAWKLPRPSPKALAGLAAALLVGVGVWSATKNGKPPVAVKQPAPRHALLEKVVQRDLALAKARTANDRLDALAGLAEDLASESRGLALVAGADEMREVADWFRTVVSDGVVEQAGKVPQNNALTPDQKRALLTRLTDRLTEAGRAAEQAAAESPPHAQPALRSIADTARDGLTKLRAIAAREGA